MFAVSVGLDWQQPEFWRYLAIAGAVVVAVSVGLYAVPGGKLKVPGIALSIVGSLGLGVALGIILMGVVGYDLRKPDSNAGAVGPEAMANGPRGGGPPGGGMMGGAPGGMMGGAGGGRGGGGRGMGSPVYRQQLATLVTKLDVLTEKPLTVKLSDDQRKEVKDSLKGLADAEELSEDDAKARFEKLHEALKDQTETLEAAGYRWPDAGGGGGGRGGGGRGGDGPKNPFSTEPNSKHLKELSARLEK